MKDFLIYFLGKGDEVEFKSFSLAHLIPLLLMVGIIFLIFHFREAIRTSRHEPLFRWILAFVAILSEMAYYWRLVALPELGPNPQSDLPISVCGWVLVFGSYMTVTKSQRLFDIIYFWLFAGTVFALATPTVLIYTGPTRFRYYQFWISHTVGYFAVFYMIFVHKMRPNLRSLVRSYVALAVLATVAFFTNLLVGPGANYLFMAKPEAAPSILDILPPNMALRILIMAAGITLLFFLAYLPWLLMDRRAKKAAEATAT